MQRLRVVLEASTRPQQPAAAAHAGPSSQQQPNQHQQQKAGGVREAAGLTAASIVAVLGAEVAEALEHLQHMFGVPSHQQVCVTSVNKYM